MKRLRILSIGIMLAASSGIFVTYADEGKETRTKMEITAVVNKLAETYKNKDIEGVMALYATGPDTIAIGADVEAGKLIGPQQIRAAYERDFSTLKEISSVEYKVISISSSANVAWLTADGFASVVENNETIKFCGRLTAVLKNINGKWLFVQTHWSFPLGAAPEYTTDVSEQTGEKLVRQLWVDMKGQNMQAIEKNTAAGFQSVHQDGSRGRQEEIALIKELNLGEYGLSDFKVTQNGSVIVATYSVSAAETIEGKQLSTKPAPRLSVFLKTDSGWQWLAHANLKPMR